MKFLTNKVQQTLAARKKYIADVCMFCSFNPTEHFSAGRYSYLKEATQEGMYYY